MSAPSQDRIDAARERLAASQSEAEAKPMKPWDVQRLAVKDSFRLDDSIKALNATAAATRTIAGRLGSAWLELRYALSTIELHRRHAAALERRIDVLERLLVEKGAIDDLELSDATDDAHDRAHALADYDHGYWDMHRLIERMLGEVPEDVMQGVLWDADHPGCEGGRRTDRP